MKVSFSCGTMSLNLYDLVDSLDDDQRREFADSLACHCHVIELVGQQILDGWTEFGSHGMKSCVMDAEPTRGLDKVVREIAKRSGEVAKKEIERLEKSMLHQEERIAKFLGELAELREQLSRLRDLRYVAHLGDA